MRREMLPGQRDFFTGPYDWTTVPGAGHFLHREQPDEVNRLVLEWLSRA
jgi:pimeloyl-ACP methyl ester carboxylesterase